ncbi:hypothetical protein TrCOL_g10491 [Triparma columacea]|uniref:Calmodulin n=1 Tax=Triparma columacea TaxID=722753 RepID=A0A9W7GMA4_9STRA|nr:hypothetical protein TrCOL_g10491 [Triparma columacea]
MGTCSSKSSDPTSPVSGGPRGSNPAGNNGVPPNIDTAKKKPPPAQGPAKEVEKEATVTPASPTSASPTPASADNSHSSKAPFEGNISMSPKAVSSSLPANPLAFGIPRAKSTLDMLKSPRKSLTKMLSSPRNNMGDTGGGGKGGRNPNRKSPLKTEMEKKAVEFRKQHLESEMASKTKDLTQETKDMFKKAYSSLSAEGDLSKANLRSLFGNLEDQAFEDVYCLFDWDNDGSVDVHEFVLTMSLLATPATSFEAEQDLLFAIFDVDGSGTMDRAEFGKMMRATLRCKMTHLDFCMKTESRKATFRRHLEGEFSTETLEFYNAVEEYRALVGSLDEEEFENMREECNDIVDMIYKTFVEEGAKEQVNIASKTRKTIQGIVEGVDTEKELFPFTIFDAAHQEVYQLMNRDTFERFKHNDTLMDQMLTSLFEEVDVEKNGVITVAEYKLWATKNPELTNFLKDLHNETFMGVSKAAGLEKRKARRISVQKQHRLSVSGQSSSGRFSEGGSEAPSSTRSSGGTPVVGNE